jgi:hypothetical protein
MAASPRGSTTVSIQVRPNAARVRDPEVVERYEQ